MTKNIVLLLLLLMGVGAAVQNSSASAVNTCIVEPLVEARFSSDSCWRDLPADPTLKAEFRLSLHSLSGLSQFFDDEGLRSTEIERVFLNEIKKIASESGRSIRVTFPPSPGCAVHLGASSAQEKFRDLISRHQLNGSDTCESVIFYLVTHWLSYVDEQQVISGSLDILNAKGKFVELTAIDKIAEANKWPSKVIANESGNFSWVGGKTGEEELDIQRKLAIEPAGQRALFFRENLLGIKSRAKIVLGFGGDRQSARSLIIDAVGFGDDTEIIGYSFDDESMNLLGFNTNDLPQLIEIPTKLLLPDTQSNTVIYYNWDVSNSIASDENYAGKFFQSNLRLFVERFDIDRDLLSPYLREKYYGFVQ